MSVGALIQRQITALGLTLEEVAEQMMATNGKNTLTRHDVWRWRADEVTPRFWLPALAQVLQIDEAELRAAARKPARPRPAAPTANTPQHLAGPITADADLVNTYAARELVGRDQWNTIIRSARRTLWLYGMAEYRYAFDDEVPRILEEAASAGCEIKVLLLDPEYAAIAEIDTDEGNPEGALATRITASLRRFHKMRQHCDAAMDIRVYASAPTTSIVRGDDQLIVTPYVRYLTGRSSPTFGLQRSSDGGMFDRYAKHFDNAWNRARDWTQ